MGDEPVMLDADDSQFQAMLSQLPSISGRTVEQEWREDDLVPCTPEEHAAGLRACIEHAREQGWIPQEDPGCQCFVCRMWRQTVG